MKSSRIETTPSRMGAPLTGTTQAARNDLVLDSGCKVILNAKGRPVDAKGRPTVWCCYPRLVMGGASSTRSSDEFASLPGFRNFRNHSNSIIPRTDIRIPGKIPY